MLLSLNALPDNSDEEVEGTITSHNAQETLDRASPSKGKQLWRSSNEQLITAGFRRLRNSQARITLEAHVTDKTILSPYHALP